MFGSYVIEGLRIFVDCLDTDRLIASRDCTMSCNGGAAIRISYLIRIIKVEQKSVENYTSRCFEKFSKTQGGKKVKKVFYSTKIMKKS